MIKAQAGFAKYLQKHIIDGLNPRMRHIAWSKVGGQSWENMSVSEELPDGDQNRDYGLIPV